MSDMKTYLAAKYMSGAKADAILARSNDPTLKKRKKKPRNEDYIGGSSKTDAGGLMFRDEDDEWERRQKEDMDVDGEEAPIVGKDIATFQKSKSSWATVGATSLALPPAQEVSVKEEPGTEAAPPEPPKQLTKRRGGLRTAKQLEEEAARIAAEAKSPSPEPDGDRPDPTVTVHRDASGRIVDVAKMKEEERLAELEEKRKEREREEWSKGFVQRQQREARAKEEAEMRQQDVGRRADDVRMNRELKEEERWNDPAAQFLTKKKSKGPKRPKYQGAYPLNRFNIPPGFRWDGVDRSNGFEKKYFQAQNSAARKQHESAAWSMEDM